MLEKSFCGVQDVHIQAMSPQARKLQDFWKYIEPAKI